MPRLDTAERRMLQFELRVARQTSALITFIGAYARSSRENMDGWLIPLVRIRDAATNNARQMR